MKRMTVFFLLIVAPALAIILAVIGLETLRENALGWILLCLGTVYPPGMLIDYRLRPERYRGPVAGAAGAEERGNLSFWLILPGFLTAFFASPLEWMYLAPVLPRLAALQIIGCGLFLAGVALAVWAQRSLGSSYRTPLAVQSGQALIDSGAYRFVRHPAYTGQLLMALGVALGYSSVIGLAAILVLLIPGLAYRIHVEERLLAARLGEAYAAYMRRTRRMIPGLW